jgi:hypothetical protein
MSIVLRTLGVAFAAFCVWLAADEDQVEPGVGGTRGLALKIGQDGGQFAAGQDLRGIDAGGSGVHMGLRGSELGLRQSVTSGVGRRQGSTE